MFSAIASPNSVHDRDVLNSHGPCWSYVGFAFFPDCFFGISTKRPYVSVSPISLALALRFRLLGIFWGGEEGVRDGERGDIAGDEWRDAGGDGRRDTDGDRRRDIGSVGRWDIGGGGRGDIGGGGRTTAGRTTAGRTTGRRDGLGGWGGGLDPTSIIVAWFGVRASGGGRTDCGSRNCGGFIGSEAGASRFNGT